jgi:predicted glycogen debranching enzyme
MLDFGRDICGDEKEAAQREWLITNGIGGFAMGTIGGLLTRRYHGLLVAALRPPLGRTLLLAKLDEVVEYGDATYDLYADRRGAAGELAPNGFIYLERFRLDGTTPVWTYALADALLEKRVWMGRNANTTYIRYTLLRGTLPLTLNLFPLVNARDFHGNTHAPDWKPVIARVEGGLRVTMFEGAPSLVLLSDRAQPQIFKDWQRDYFLSVEEYRGLDPLDDHLLAGVFSAALNADESVTIIASSEAAPDLDTDQVYAARQSYESSLIAQSGLADAPPAVRQLVLAADQFIVQRGTPNGRTVLAGYPWFSDWGRDTMIALPGLTLTTRRYDDAAKILRTFARFVDRGMLPNRFPDEGETPEYNTVDATLWYFQAVAAYHAATADDSLLRDLFPILQDIIDWHIKGTRYGIRVDPADSLLYAGEPGAQLTWMDVKIDDWVVTPRHGKAVEINALWHNALCHMRDFAAHLGEPGAQYRALAAQVKASFARFWNAEAGCCYDVIDTPQGNDATLRPNQVIAASLPYSPLTDEQARAVVDVCGRALLVSHGLRSLAPDHPDYRGIYGGDIPSRDSAYHQGTVWSWLIGAFVAAHLRVYGDKTAARSFLMPLLSHLRDHGIGSISEIFDGDPPHRPRGCIAQAWGVAEVLRAWSLTSA